MVIQQAVAIPFTYNDTLLIQQTGYFVVATSLLVSHILFWLAFTVLNMPVFF